MPEASKSALIKLLDCTDFLKYGVGPSEAMARACDGSDDSVKRFIHVGGEISWISIFANLKNSMIH